MAPASMPERCPAWHFTLYDDGESDVTDNSYADMPIIRIISSISNLIRSEDALDEKYTKALELIREAVAFDAASLFLFDENEGNLVEAASNSALVEMIESTPFQMGKGLSAWVAKQRESVLIPELRKERPDGFRSFLSTPLVMAVPAVTVEFGPLQWSGSCLPAQWGSENDHGWNQTASGERWSPVRPNH